MSSIQLNEEMALVRGYRSVSAPGIDAPTHSRDPVDAPLPVSHRRRADTHHRFDRAGQFALLRSYFDDKFVNMEQRLPSEEATTTNEKYESKGESPKIQGEFTEQLKMMGSHAKTIVESGAMMRPLGILEDLESRLVTYNLIIL